MVSKKPRIVIVGAGMAGLTAAHRLYTSSGDLFDLCVVEASDRIGGRIRTSEFAGDRVEMGATWIHGIGGSPIYAMAQDIQALSDPRPWERMDGFPTDPVTVAEGGAVVDPGRVVAPVTALYRCLMDSARAGDAVIDPKDPSVGYLLRHGLERYRASRGDAGGGSGSEGDWTLEALEDAVLAIHENTERTCTSADDLRGLDLAAESEYRDFPGDQITIAKGYSRIVETLAAVLPPGVIRFGRWLRRIEWCPEGGGGSGGPVRLHFEGDYTPMAADHVIITVSLGVLKAGLGLGKEVGLGSPAGPGVVFSPSLPDFKRSAIGRLGFGVVDKLFMEMDVDVDDDIPSGRFFPFLQLAFDQAGSSARHVAKIPRWMRKTHSICPIYGGSKVLLAWFAGKEAVELESLDDREIIRGSHATLDAFLHHRRRRIARVKRSAWASDPLFLGSYSYVAVGSSGDDLDLMAEPLPRPTSAGDAAPPPLQILFAGEATHRSHYSTTHGAYFSGIREANRLLQHYRYTSTFV